MHNQVADCDAVAVEDLQDVWNSIQANIRAGATPRGGLAATETQHAVEGRLQEVCCMLEQCVRLHVQMRARCAGTLFKGFQRGHSSTYTLQAVLCQMLGSFGTLVSA